MVLDLFCRRQKCFFNFWPKFEHSDHSERQQQFSLWNVFVQKPFQSPDTKFLAQFHLTEWPEPHVVMTRRHKHLIVRTGSTPECLIIVKTYKREDWFIITKHFLQSFSFKMDKWVLSSSLNWVSATWLSDRNRIW